MGHLAPGIAWHHRRLHVREVHLGGHASHIAALIKRMDLRRNFLQAHALVTGMFCDKLGQHLPQGLVLIKVIFELLQLGHEGIPTPFGNTNRKHDEEGIKPSFFNNHTMLG